MPFQAPKTAADVLLPLTGISILAVAGSPSCISESKNKPSFTGLPSASMNSGLGRAAPPALPRLQCCGSQLHRLRLFPCAWRQHILLCDNLAHQHALSACSRQSLLFLVCDQCHHAGTRLGVRARLSYTNLRGGVRGRNRAHASEYGTEVAGNALAAGILKPGVRAWLNSAKGPPLSRLLTGWFWPACAA